MQPSAITIRQRFIREYGKPAFEKSAHAFVDAGGDSRTVQLVNIPEWRTFACSFEIVPDILFFLLFFFGAFDTVQHFK